MATAASWARRSLRRVNASPSSWLMLKVSQGNPATTSATAASVAAIPAMSASAARSRFDMPSTTQGKTDTINPSVASDVWMSLMEFIA